jgi:hypothetical protein
MEKVGPDPTIAISVRSRSRTSPIVRKVSSGDPVTDFRFERDLPGILRDLRHFLKVS